MSLRIQRTNLLMSLLSALILYFLLLIGNIERNPGPFPCKHCNILPETIASHVRHQNFHANGRNKNFVFYCPAEGCIFFSKSFGGLNYHVSQYHCDTRHQDPASTLSIVCPYSREGNCCSFTTASFWEFVQHLCEHLDAGVKIQCPVDGCSFSKDFIKKNTFRSHLSQYHPTWRAEGCPKQKFKAPPAYQTPNEEVAGDDVDFMNSDEVMTELPEIDESSDCDLLNDDLVYDSVAKFYLNLYGVNVLPFETIQEISEDLTYLSELASARVKLVLSTELKKLGLPEDQIKFLCQKTLLADPLYAAHHKNVPGPNLSSDYFRKKYFRENFDYIAPKEISLDEDDETSEKKYQYVSIEATLKKVFEDPSVQREIDKSFQRQQTDPNIITDYTDGGQFQSEDHPLREIQINLYQDAVNVAMNPLGSAKDKYKMVAAYFTIGNLPSKFRSKVPTKHLILLVRESVFKEKKEKCFEKAISELLELEKNGMLYKGENVKVVVEFFVGDSLGQHVVGGFIESFSAEYFCRFCDITRPIFKANPTLTYEQRTIREYDRCVSQAVLLGEHVKGIKSDCDFNKLQYFHATSHLAPCIAHDLFEGVISWDMAGIIRHFVREKKFFTYKLLNRRIKNFKCNAGDQPNKPAYVPKKGERLGGHAIQNWTMLRLFQFIIGDKITDHSDPGWVLFLKLKKLCEYFCAPVIKKIDVPYIKDVLLPDYFEQRELVLDESIYPLKPKHHFMAHYPELMLRLGPLMFLWTLPFEQKHKFFRHVIRLSRNFINPEFTCAVRHQLNFCHMTMGEMFPEECTEVESKAFSAQQYSGDVANFLTSLELDGPWLDSRAVCYNGLTYEKNDVILLSSEGGCLQLGIVRVIATKCDCLNLLLEKVPAQECQEEGIYNLPTEPSGQLMWVSVEDLKFPVRQAVYTYKGKLCFALKFILPELEC